MCNQGDQFINLQLRQQVRSSAKVICPILHTLPLSFSPASSDGPRLGHTPRSPARRTKIPNDGGCDEAFGDEVGHSGLLSVMNIIASSPCLQFLENPRLCSWVQASWGYILARRPENDDVLENWPKERSLPEVIPLPCPPLNVVDDIRIERIDLAADLIVAEVESEIEGQSEDSTSTEEVPALTHRAISSRDSRIQADALMARNLQRAERRLRQL